MYRNSFAIRIWLVLSVLALSLVGSPAFAQAGTVVRVDPSALSAQVNNSINVSIKADNVSSLIGMELHLSFNPDVLEVTGLAHGGFVAADLIAQNTYDNTAGTVDYGIAQLNRSPAQGSGTLLTITFRAKANGSSSVALRATPAAPSGFILSDSNGLAIPASWVAGTVTVGNSTAVPPTAVPPTAIPPTSIPPTAVPPTAVGPTSTSPTSIPPTAIPPTSVPPTPTPVPSGGTLGTHVVRFGESLYCIGRAYKVTPWSIAEKNGIWWPYIIFPTQKLVIPNVAWSPIPVGPVCQSQLTTTPTPVPTSVPTSVPATPAATVIVPTSTVPTATPVPTSTVCRAYYIVRPGDNLFRISLGYGKNYEDVARVNNIANPRLIYVGQQLCIP